MRLPTYNGSLPYIFVSYAHKDSETVLPILSALQENGFRLWFDQGIVPVPTASPSQSTPS